MDGAEPGRLLAGRYRLGEVIGRGGMGVVWRAADELLDRDVAVKEIIWPASFTEHEQQTACRRASREAQMAARLNHPNVIRIYDIVEEDGNPWIVMELLPYRSLRDRVQEEGPLAPAQAAQVGLAILAALRAAHAEGIVHRDVKPANILVGLDDDRVVLTDFGIARAADSATLTTAGVLIGSPSYIAPERARGGPSGASGDLWGLGATLYAAVEGRPPFDREHALASLTAVVADEPDPPTHAGPLWPVISGLLRKDPEARLTAAETEQLLNRVVAAPDRARANQVPTIPTPADEPPADPVSAPSDPAPPAPPEPAPAEPAPAEPEAAGPVSPGRSRSPRLWRPRGRLAALIGVVALAVLAATATGVALALTGSPGHQTASPPASTRPGTSSSPRPSASPTGSATASSGGNAGNAGTGALPAGWYRFTNSTGFSIGVPQGWQISHVGHYVYITDPTGSSSRPTARAAIRTIT
jgi:eukaryotic-like serine/threonine-protein kinase